MMKDNLEKERLLHGIMQGNEQRSKEHLSEEVKCVSSLRLAKRAWLEKE